MKILAHIRALFSNPPPAAPPAPPEPRRVRQVTTCRFFRPHPTTRSDEGGMTDAEFLAWLRERRAEYLKPREKS
jgi:hypothetical protein